MSASPKSPKTKSPKSKSSKKTVKSVIAVSLSNRNGDAYAQANASKIVAWYTQRMTTGSYYPTFITNFKISHIGANLFEMDYKTSDVTMTDPDAVADPDDDGNHPIKIGKLDYFVGGRIIKVTGGSLRKTTKAGAKKYLMQVSLLNRDAPDASVAANAKKITAWYRKYVKGNDYLNTFISHFKITHLTGDLFTFELKSDESMIEAEGVADLDGDGNHPIKVGKTSYLVAGHVLRKL